MNHDEKFQQQWEFRSDETAVERHKLVTDLVLLGDEEANDTFRCQRNDNIDTHKTLLKKVESNKKKNLVQKKSNKKKINSIPKEMVRLDDLKVFADSLILELTVARENMFAHMRDEMRTLVSPRPNLEQPKKNKACPLDEIELIDGNLKGNVPNKFSEAVENEDDLQGLAILGSDSDQVASLSYLTLPTVLPKPQIQNHTNGFPMNDRIPAGGPMNHSGSENNFYHRVAGFDPEQGFGNFSDISSKTVGFLGQNCIQTPGFPVPLHQGMEHGPNALSLSYGDNSFLNNIKVCPRMNSSMLRFPSEGKFANNMNSYVLRKTAGEFEITES